MKKNLILFSICVLLGTTAYLIEEKGAIERKAEQERRETIFNMHEMGAVKEFRTKNAAISFTGSKVFIIKNKRAVDTKRLKVAFDELSKIRLVRVLDDSEINKENRKFFFPNENDVLEFEFEKGRVRYLLGKKIATSRAFYLEIQKPSSTHQVIVHNPDPVKVVVSKEKSESDDTHYRTFKSLVYLNDFFFEDLHILFGDLKNRVNLATSIQFNNKRNRPFELQVKEAKTIPVPPGKIGVSHKKIQNYLKSLSKVTATKQWEPFERERLKGRIGSVAFSDNSSKVWSLDLFKEYKKEGYFLLVNNGLKERMYSIKAMDAHLLMSNSQDFWDKTLVLPKNPLAKLKFPQEETIALKVSDDKRFSVQTLNSKKEVNNKEFHKIYNFLKREAEFVTEGGVDIKGNIVQNLFNLELNDVKLKVMRTRGEIIVQDEGNNVKYHYIAGNNLPFSYKVDEVAPLKKVIK